MADEPGFQVGSGHFDVELQGQDVPALGEGLMAIEVCGRQQVSPFRQIEGVPVPVQD